MENIIGKTIEQVKGMSIDFGSAYPIVKNGVVTGTVDGNYPDEFNGGEWEIVEDFYAQATSATCAGCDEECESLNDAGMCEDCQMLLDAEARGVEVR